jgi:hypothetical protein
VEECTHAIESQHLANKSAAVFEVDLDAPVDVVDLPYISLIQCTVICGQMSDKGYILTILPDLFKAEDMMEAERANATLQD